MQKYKSKLSGKEISATHYIVEIICIKNSAISGRELPESFMKLPYWKQFYGAQLKRAKILLENYPADAIIKALNDPKAKKIYSLYFPGLPKMIMASQIILDKQKQSILKQEELSATQEPEISTGNFKRDNFKKNNLLDQLD